MTQGLHSLNGRLAAANNVCRRPWEPLPLRWQRRRSFQLSRSFRGVGTETSEDSLLSSSKKANKPAAFYPPPLQMDPGSYRALWFLAELPSWRQEIYLPVKQEDCLYMAQRTLYSVPCTWVDGFQASEVQRGGAAEGWRLFGESAVVVVGRGTEPGAGFFFFFGGSSCSPHLGVLFTIITYRCLLNKYFPS